MCKGWEDYKVLSFADDITKATLSPQLLEDSECLSGYGLNQRPPARQTSAYPIELDEQWNPTYLLQIYNLR